MSTNSFGPNAPFSNSYQTSIENHIDQTNTAINNQEMQISDIQASVEEMYSIAGQGDYWKAVLCGIMVVLFGVLNKSQNDAEIGVLKEGTANAMGALITRTQDLFGKGASYNGPSNTGGLTQADAQEYVELEADAWWDLNATDYHGTGNNPVYFWDDELKGQIDDSISDMVTMTFNLSEEPSRDENLPVIDPKDLEKYSTEAQSQINNMWWQQGQASSSPPSKQTSQCIDDLQEEAAAANSQLTAFNSDYETATNTTNSIMASINDCLNSVLDIYSVTAKHLAPQ